MPYLCAAQTEAMLGGFADDACTFVTKKTKTKTQKPEEEGSANAEEEEAAAEVGSSEANVTISAALADHYSCPTLPDPALAFDILQTWPAWDPQVCTLPPPLPLSPPSSLSPLCLPCILN